MNSRALIIDDEQAIRELLEITLNRMNIETLAVDCVERAKQSLKHLPFDLCITDIKLPDGTGLEILQYIQANTPDLPVAVLTAFGQTDLAVSSLKAGAFDFLQKPVELEKLREVVQHALKLSDKTIQENTKHTCEIIGQCTKIEELKSQIRKLARSQAPVFIQGESGTGKELVARLIHQLGARANKPFIAVNCGAIPTELMESEFFGHKKGSFTGAIEDKQGLFQSAQGGTLFLDEVADLPLHMQVKLLRAIQEKSVRPIGSAKEIALDVRILSATHKNLMKLVTEEKFRQDLYYRINVIEVGIPPLRERGEDLFLIIDHLLEKLAKNWAIKKPILHQKAKELLLQHAFPGNIRELENILERAITLSDNNLILAEHLRIKLQEFARESILESTFQTEQPSKGFTTSSDAPQKIPKNFSLESYLSDIERKFMVSALEETKWNRTHAAKLLNISFRTLRYKLKKLGLDDSIDESEEESE